MHLVNIESKIDLLRKILKGKKNIYFDYQKFYFNGDYLNIGTNEDLIGFYLEHDLRPSWHELFSINGPVLFSNHIPLPSYVEKEKEHQQNIQFFNSEGIKNRVYFTVKNFDGITLIGIGHEKEGPSGLIDILNEFNKYHFFVKNFEEQEKDLIENMRKKFTIKTEKIVSIDDSYQYPYLNSLNINLTKSEINCLGLINKGMTSSEISKHLFLSSRTIEKHIENIKRKTGIQSKKSLSNIFY